MWQKCSFQVASLLLVKYILSVIKHFEKLKLIVNGGSRASKNRSKKIVFNHSLLWSAFRKFWAKIHFFNPELWLRKSKFHVVYLKIYFIPIFLLIQKIIYLFSMQNFLTYYLKKLYLWGVSFAWQHSNWV